MSSAAFRVLQHFFPLFSCFQVQLSGIFLTDLVPNIDSDFDWFEKLINDLMQDISGSNILS